MELNIYANKIYEIENFLSEEDHRTLLNIIAEVGDDWNSAQNNYWKGKNISVDHPIMNKIYEKVVSLFTSYSHINSTDSINRFKPGDSMGEHSDAVGHHEIKFGIVIYINDDFNGGEICYPQIGITHKPKARSIIIHPGDLDHFVNEVLDGPIRYSITTFVHGTEDKPAILGL